MTARVLVVGNSGFLAKRLFDALSTDFRVSHTQREDEREDFYLDLRNDYRTWRVPFDEFDFVIQAAGVGGEFKCQLDYPNSWKINVDSNVEIARALVRTECNLIVISTSYVYDLKPQVPNEKFDFPYTYQKLSAETRLQSILQNLTIVRPGRLLGIESPEFTAGVSNLQNCRPLFKFKNTRFLPIHIDYFTKLLVNIIENKILGQINFAPDRGITPYLFWRLLASYLHLDPNLVFESESKIRDRTSDAFIQKSYFDLQKLSTTLPSIEGTIKCLMDEFFRKISL